MAHPHPPNNDNLLTYKIVVVGDGGGKLKEAADLALGYFW